jgi:hypothetical protein
MSKSQLLTSGQVGNTAASHMKVIRESVINKWDGIGFLEGLNGHIKENMAQLYENQANSLLRESTDSGSSGSFETVVFPIVRRVFSKLLANDIVSVQALNMPIGKLFFFLPKTSARDNDGAHTSLDGRYLPEEVYSAGRPSTPFMETTLYDLYYNDGLFDNSKGKITIMSSSAADISFEGMKFQGKTLVATETFVEHNDGGVRNAILEVTGFQSSGIPGTLIGADGQQMDTESFLASLKVVNGANAIVDKDNNVIIAAGGEIPFRLVTQKYGKGIVQYQEAVDVTGKLYIELDLSAPVANDQTITSDGYIGADRFDIAGPGADAVEGNADDSLAITTTNLKTELEISYAKYATLELETEMGEVSFELSEVTVDVEERKLRATWSPELAQDVSAFHNIDAEAELTAMLSEQVAAEIDREILRDLRVAAAWSKRWDYFGWRKAASASNAYTQKDWNQTLLTIVNQISAQIHKTTLRGGANFIVVSSEISAIFDDLEYFHVSDASAEQDEYNMGIEKVGSLGGRYQVYRDPYAPAESMIIGHKGKSLLDTGYIYAPYVPLQLTPTMYNPHNFAPVKGIMTRYAKKVVNNRFYGHVRIDNVQTFNMNEIR